MKNRNRGKKINIILLKNKIPDHLIIIIEVVCNINNKTMSIKNMTTSQTDQFDTVTTDQFDTVTTDQLHTVTNSKLST